MLEIEGQIAEARTALKEAMVLQSAGNLAAAAPRYARVVALNYRTVEVLPILAGILAQVGNLDESLAQWDACRIADGRE